MAKKNHTDTAEKPVSQAGQTELGSADQTSADTAASIPTPDNDPAETKPQIDIDTAADEPVIISSVIHNTIVIDDTAAVAASDAAPDGTPAPTDEEMAAIRQENADFSMIDESRDNPYRNVFLESLDRVTADDLGKPPKKKKKDPVDVIIDIFRGAIFWAAVAAFFISGFQIVSKLYSYRQSEDIYDINIFDPERREDLVAPAIRSQGMSTLTPVNGTKEESAELGNAASGSQFNEKLLIFQGQLQILRNTNKEIIGWIEIPGGTEVNYPLVQGADNDYYLHYAYNGAYNPAGSIYMDYRNRVTVSQNRHTIIYGHNMESGSPMFANLLHYKDDAFYKNNRYINIYTDEALYKYEVFAAYETSPRIQGVEQNSWRMNFNQDEKVFMSWIDSIRKRSDISTKIAVTEKDRVLTLSTCMNINDNRYVVHAVLVEVVK